MNVMTPGPRAAQRLNHVEFVHRPGERALVFALFDLLGFKTYEVWDGQIVIGVIDPPTFDEADNENVLTGCEVRTEQWAFDQALEKALRQQPLAEPYAGYQGLLAQYPHWGMHFGIRLHSPEKWEAAVACFADVEKHAPALKERVRLMKVFRPGDADAPGGLRQAFVWTDVIASGSLALGQRIELTTVVT